MRPTSAERAIAIPAVALAVGVVSFVAVVGTLETFKYLSASPRISSSAAFAALLGSVIALYSVWGRAYAGRASLFVAIAVIGWVPVLFAIGDVKLGEAIARGSMERAGPYDDGPTASALPDAAAWATALCPLVAALGAPFVAKLVRSSARTRMVAAASWAVGALLVVLAFAKGQRHPDPDMYFGSLPSRGEVEHGSIGSIGTTEVLFSSGEGRGWNCHLEETKTRRRLTSDSLPCGGKLGIARDDANDLFVLGNHHAGRAERADAALRGSPLEPVAVYARTIPKSIAPPIGWVLGAAAGLFIALVPLVAAIVFRRRARIEGKDAFHRGGGVVDLDGGPTITLRDAAYLPVGPVCVDAPAAGSSSYRTAPSLPTRVLAVGTIAAVRDELEARSIGASTTAVAILMLSCATLLASAAHRLYF